MLEIRSNTPAHDLAQTIEFAVASGKSFTVRAANGAEQDTLLASLGTAIKLLKPMRYETFTEDDIRGWLAGPGF